MAPSYDLKEPSLARVVSAESAVSYLNVMRSAPFLVSARPTGITGDNL